MNAGPLRHQVTVEQPSRTPNAIGGFTVLWTTFLTSPANISPVSGGERFFAGKLEGDVTHKVTLRYRTGVTAQMRIKYVFGGVTRYLQIRGVVNPGERNEWLELKCAEGPAS